VGLLLQVAQQVLPLLLARLLQVPQLILLTVSGTTVTGNTGQFTNLAGAAAGFTTVTGTTVTGTTANFVSGVFTTRISGTTVTGTTASFTSGVFASLSGTTHTITSGVFALGTAALPSISFVSDPNTGIYSPGADQVAVATNGTGRLFIDANGSISINATGPKNPEGYNTTNFKFLTLQATTGATDRGAILELVGTGGGSPNFWLGRIGFFSTGNSYPHTSIESFTTAVGVTAVLYFLIQPLPLTLAFRQNAPASVAMVLLKSKVLALVAVVLGLVLILQHLLTVLLLTRSPSAT
jgi:hypothetical protein